MKYVELLEAVKPVIFYHGSNHEIVSFTLDHLGTGAGHDQYGPGIYLTSSPTDASRYGQYVYTVAVNIPRSRYLGKRRISREQVKALISKSGDCFDRLTNWDENPQVAFQSAVDSIMSAYGNDLKEACIQIWYDFYYPNLTPDYKT